MTRKCKIIVRNKVFECLTLLKIEVIEYGKNGLQNGLKCILRDIDFKKKSGGGPLTPPPPPPQMTRKCKIIVWNKVFECLTLLKIEVIEYGKMGFKMARNAFSER